jgi:hypothetical protein
MVLRHVRFGLPIPLFRFLQFPPSHFFARGTVNILLLAELLRLLL